MYKNIRSIISNSDAERLANIIRSQPETSHEDDDQVPNAYGTWYSIPACNTLLGLLCERVSKEAGRKLLPTYTYCRIYTADNELLPHRDRPSCEWSVTVNLSQSEPWPIYMDGKEIIQDVGDGALYQGCEVYHWRKPFKGSEYIQVFLHYVDADGPYKDFVDDKGTIKQLKEPFSYKFLRINPNLNKWYKFDQGFTPDECTTIINTFKHKTLIRAGVGEGTTNENVRRSKILWIPKNSKNDWVYRRMTDLINHANNDFFKVEISEILEEIQFTQYEVGDKYNWHVDVGGDNLRGGRKLSVVVQLSDPDEYEGGELQFGPASDTEIEVADNNKGCAIIFPSFMRHRATEVTKGTRYSLVLWITGPSYR